MVTSTIGKRKMVKKSEARQTGYAYSKFMPLPPMGGFVDDTQEKLYRELCIAAKAYCEAEDAFLNYSPDVEHFMEALDKFCPKTSEEK